MADRQARSGTNISWERKCAIWSRMARGDKIVQIGLWLDEEEYHLDRKTNSKLKAELRICLKEKQGACQKPFRNTGET